MLFAIVGDRRKQAFFTSAENIKLRKIKQFHFLTMKRPNLSRPLHPLICFYAHKIENYILQITVTFYIDIQKMLVKPEVKELLVIWGKPHKPAASVAVSRWIKDNYLVHKST